MALLFAASILLAFSPLFVSMLHITVGMVWRADFLLGRVDSVRTLVKGELKSTLPNGCNMYLQLVEIFNHVKGFASDAKLVQMKEFYQQSWHCAGDAETPHLEMFFRKTKTTRKLMDSSRYWGPSLFLCFVYLIGFTLGMLRFESGQNVPKPSDTRQTTQMQADPHVVPAANNPNRLTQILVLIPNYLDYLWKKVEISAGDHLPNSENTNDTELRAYDAIIFAFLGSFVFNTGIMVRRVFVWDISGQMYWWAVYRTVLSLGLAYVLDITTDKIDPRYFFLIATASVSILDNASRSLRAKLFQSESIPKQTDLSLQLIQGIDFWKEQRLMEEGIESVQHLATTDFVLLALHTRSPLYTILDWVDQSIFIQRFPGKIEKLKDVGLPLSAVELTWNWVKLRKENPGETPPKIALDMKPGGRFEFLQQLEDATGIKGPIWSRTLDAWSIDNQVSLLTLFWRADLGGLGDSGPAALAPPPPPDQLEPQQPAGPAQPPVAPPEPQQPVPQQAPAQAQPEQQQPAPPQQVPPPQPAGQQQQQQQ
ncbi:MAG TPA: hypothetical protein VIM62_13755 [Acidobacteriaceae bacterium]